MEVIGEATVISSQGDVYTRHVVLYTEARVLGGEVIPVEYYRDESGILPPFVKVKLIYTILDRTESPSDRSWDNNSERYGIMGLVKSKLSTGIGYRLLGYNSDLLHAEAGNSQGIRLLSADGDPIPESFEVTLYLAE